MTKADLLEIDGIGETTAEALTKDGVTTTDDLKRALQELESPAGHIYSTFQLTVLSELDLPTIGKQTVSQYTRRTFTENEVVYEWERESETFIVELQKEDDSFRSKWFTSSGEVFSNERYEHRSDAVNALTRWAYRPPESA